MEHVVERTLKLSHLKNTSKKTLAQAKDQDRLFTLTNVPWSLYFCSVLYNFQKTFPQWLSALLTIKIVMVSHRQVILLNIVQNLFVMVQDAA